WPRDLTLQALRLAREAERGATFQATRLRVPAAVAWEPRALPWARAGLEQADARRRDGQRLLLAGKFKGAPGPLGAAQGGPPQGPGPDAGGLRRPAAARRGAGVPARLRRLPGRLPPAADARPGRLGRRGPGDADPGRLPGPAPGRGPSSARRPGRRHLRA